MSERTHSASASPAPTGTRRGRMVPLILGTATIVMGAGLLFQWLRPESARSQTSNAPAAAAPQASEVMARVNGQTIHYDLLARECVERHGADVLENIINRTLIQQACNQRGITVTDAEVQQEVINVAAKFNLPRETWYQMLQSERGLTPAQYHRDVIWPMLALKKLAGTTVNVTEADMYRAFERDYGPRVRARLILLEGNVRQAQQIWEQCQRNPENFEAIAREHSADPNTRSLGGLIPPIRMHGGDPRIEEVAFAMQPGQISGLIAIHNRYVILKCEGFTDPIVNDIRQVWDELLAQLTEEKVQESVAMTFESLLNSAEIHNHLTQTSTAGTPYGGGTRSASAVQQTAGTASLQPNSPPPTEGQLNPLLTQPAP